MKALFLAAGLAAACTVSVLAVRSAEARRDEPKEVKKAVAVPANPVGDWTGTWGLYSPPGADGKPVGKPSPYEQARLKLDCKVVAVKDGKFQATFEGECGRPYKYTIQMLGRSAGGVVLFQGTADLGEKDGGVYDWIGRANNDDFIGFYTSSGHTGTFRLTRPKKAADAQQN